MLGQWGLNEMDVSKVDSVGPKVSKGDDGCSLSDPMEDEKTILIRAKGEIFCACVTQISVRPKAEFLLHASCLVRLCRFNHI
ncbi:hypothetical protein VNO78_34167 [Psophocarpus tetragonolobus]|uniref:Uncharacterized protein n=1 Tax=Psophocarpus tetragonolobus TaxID=3891 RepID=A0AAN9RQ07_PSOTE